jgi:hypothetical protein
MAKNIDQDITTTDMAVHAALLGAAAFVYMALFGHGLPTAMRGPIGRKIATKVRALKP